MKETNIIIRVSREFKSMLEGLAKGEGMAVSEYVRYLVKREAGEVPQEHQTYFKRDRYK